MGTSRNIDDCLGMRGRWARDTAYSFSGRGNSGDNDVGPILLPPRDYDTVHRHRGNLAGIEFRRCLNQTIVGGSTTVDRGGTRSAASSGIGSDSAATPPPYQSHHPLGPRPSRPSRDSSSGKSIIPASILFSFFPSEIPIFICRLPSIQIFILLVPFELLFLFFDVLIRASILIEFRPTKSIRIYSGFIAVNFPPVRRLYRSSRFL